MVILGIDPGIAIVGYGVIDYTDMKMRLIDYGAILTPAGMKIPERLDIIFDSMTEIIEKFRPDAIAFEELFFAKNVKTAITVAQARGVAVTAAYKKNKEIYEYTPLQIKQALTGYGRADKLQIQTMVKNLLGLSSIPKPDDAADAVAVAITHAQSISFSNDFRM